VPTHYLQVYITTHPLSQLNKGNASSVKAKWKMSYIISYWNVSNMRPKELLSLLLDCIDASTFSQEKNTKLVFEEADVHGDSGQVCCKFFQSPLHNSLNMNILHCMYNSGYRPF